MDIIIVENKKYYNSNDVKITHRQIFSKCKRLKDIIENEKLNECDYCYARLIKDVWCISNESHKTSKLLLSVKYVNRTIKQLNCEKKDAVKKLECKVFIELPPLLELNENEKFKNADGVVADIETRGERRSSKCYFKMRDVSRAFEIDKLQEKIMCKESNFFPDSDYVIFVEPDGRRELYLTFNGVIVAMYSTNNKHTEVFQNWITSVLFPIQLGKTACKSLFALNMLGVRYNI